MSNASVDLQELEIPEGEEQEQLDSNEDLSQVEEEPEAQEDLGADAEIAEEELEYSVENEMEQETDNVDDTEQALPHHESPYVTDYIVQEEVKEDIRRKSQVVTSERKSSQREDERDVEVLASANDFLEGEIL